MSWCTVWKGTPQDCMDHVRGAHDVPWDVKSTSLEMFVPPWTVRRQVWSDSLVANHSGISTDVLLFSDINLSLTHHYRVHKRGLPHIAFRKNYLTRLHISVSETSRHTRHGRRRLRPVRILEVSELPTLTAQDLVDLPGALVFDCRPPLLPVSL